MHRRTPQDVSLITICKLDTFVLPTMVFPPRNQSHSLKGFAVTLPEENGLFQDFIGLLLVLHLPTPFLICLSGRLIVPPNFLLKTGALCCIICTKSLTIRETAFRLLTIWYFTPSKLHSIDSGVSTLWIFKTYILGL